jgi:vacuolar-type H+-ATPase subunit I/STV1
MAELVIILVAAGIAAVPAILVRSGYFWSAGLIFAGWLAAAIWAWNVSTDTRHPDYAWAYEGGDAYQIFAVQTVLFGLPLYLLGAFVGLAVRCWRDRTPDKPSANEIES